MNRNPYIIGIVAMIGAAAIALSCFIVVDSTPPEPEPDELALTIDAHNAASMHKFGLPTKSDVMAYHVYGHWGYYEDGQIRLFAELPGSERAWDKFYTIDPNKAFKY